MNAAAHIARTDPTAKATCPTNSENVTAVADINAIEIKGNPKTLAMKDANVCSCHVTGSQYGT